MTPSFAWTRVREERGSITAWFACASLVMVLMVGMTVDLGGKVHTQQRAHSVAAQAARTGAEELQASSAVRGQHLAIDAAKARRAALTYLHTAGMAGTVVVTGGDTLVVTTTDTYDARFLGFIGLGSMRVSGEASARLIRSEGGLER